MPGSRIGRHSARLTASAWGVTILQAVAYQLGGFIGSALIPIYSPKHPKATVLTSSLTMSVFIGAFVTTSKLKGGPIPMIVLAFVMYICSG